MSFKDWQKGEKEDMEGHMQGKVLSKFSGDITLLESNRGGVETIQVYFQHVHSGPNMPPFL